MHPSLSGHLHTDQCNILIDEYKKCMEENKFGRFLGLCSDIQRKMESCLQNEIKQKRIDSNKKRQEEDIQNYAKKNPQFAEKIKLLEKMKKEKEQNETQK